MSVSIRKHMAEVSILKVSLEVPPPNDIDDIFTDTKGKKSDRLKTRVLRNLTVQETQKQMN